TLGSARTHRHQLPVDRQLLLETNETRSEVWLRISANDSGPVFRRRLSRSSGLCIARRLSLRHTQRRPRCARQFKSIHFPEFTRGLFAGHVSPQLSTHAQSRDSLGLLRRDRRTRPPVEQLRSASGTCASRFIGTSTSLRSRLEQLLAPRRNRMECARK